MPPGPLHLAALAMLVSAAAAEPGHGDEHEHEHELPWYIELAESMPLWVYILLFLLPLVASFAQIWRDDK
eukprot:SAG22_NODE_18900_length_280_cov_0.845304_1_plen_69_part_10